jgi:adenine-specific DNA-methyltransferase
MKKNLIDTKYTGKSKCYLGNIDCLVGIRELPNESVDLVITSPPYNLGKDYEHRVDIEKYLEQQTEIIAELYRVLKDGQGESFYD